MKKRLVLKESVKEVLVVIGMILVIGLCIKGLALQEQHEYKRAVERCGGESNIVQHYTSQGDKYYTCANER